MNSLAMLIAATTLLQWASGEAQPPCVPGTYTPNPDNCTSYFFCDTQNVHQLLICSPGQHFNPKSSVCEWGSTCPVSGESSGEGEVTDAFVTNQDIPAEEVNKYVQQTTIVEPEGESDSKLITGPLLSLLKNLTIVLDVGNSSKEEASSELQGKDLFSQTGGLEEVDANTDSSPTEVPAGLENTSINASDLSTTTEKKIEGRCGVDSVVVGYPTVASVEEKKQDESSEEVAKDRSETDSGESRGDKFKIVNPNSNDSYTVATLWPLFPIVNGTFGQVDNSLPVLSPVPADKDVQAEKQNVTSDEITDTKFVDFPFTGLKKFTPLVVFGPHNEDHSNGGASAGEENSDTPNAEEEKTEIEEAKSTLIFESHTTLKPTDNIGYFPDDKTKLVIGNPVL